MGRQPGFDLDAELLKGDPLETRLAVVNFEAA
jgi:hypothetical protein